jgi:hypothetical protein
MITLMAYFSIIFVIKFYNKCIINIYNYDKYNSRLYKNDKEPAELAPIKENLFFRYT